MKRTVLVGSIIAAMLVTTTVLALGRRTTTPATPVSKTHQYRCTDRNQSLYFLVHEENGKLVDGLMYVENMQVANMSVEQAGTEFIKAKVNGNSANVAFLLGKGGTVMVANYQTSNRVEVCKASYKYQ
jgi:hypothetical protein